MLFYEFWKNYHKGVIITESRKKRYREQYLRKGIAPDDENLQGLVDTLINLKNDELAKYLITQFHKHEKDNPDDVRENLANNYEAYTRRRFLHYAGLNIPSINNYRYGKEKTLTDVLNDFTRFEREWLAKQDEGKQWIDMTEELREGTVDIIHKFSDGFAWVMLDRASCDKEGEAMGHCGNSGGDREGKILSLRKLRIIKGKTIGRPSLTFIRDKEWYLGEMKGRGNQKPDKKYHPYIIALLKEKIRVSTRTDETAWFIQGIRGGGWLPKNNFSIDDLSPELASELFSIREDLFGFDMWIKNAGGLTEEVYAKILMAFPDVFADDIKIASKVISFTINNDTPYILSQMNNIPDKVEKYIEHGEDFIENYYDYSNLSEGDCHSFYNILCRNTAVLDTLKEKIIEQKDEVMEYWDTEDETVISQLDDDEIFEVLFNIDEDFQMALRNSIHDGNRYGEESAYHKHYQNQITNLVFISSEDPIPLSIEEYSFNNTVVTVPINNAKDLIKYGRLVKYLNEIDGTEDDSDVSEYSGYGEFDAEAAVESFINSYY